jgi:membrane-associated phospholipid phosphatase
MHGIGVGGLMGLMTVILIDGNLQSGLPYIVSLLISASVMTARKIVSDHHWFDIITGFILGFACQLVALWV